MDMIAATHGLPKVALASLNTGELDDLGLPSFGDVFNNGLFECLDFVCLGAFRAQTDLFDALRTLVGMLVDRGATDLLAWYLLVGFCIL